MFVALLEISIAQDLISHKPSIKTKSDGQKKNFKWACALAKSVLKALNKLVLNMMRVEA